MHYWGTSALVKQFIQEIGTDEARSRCELTSRLMPLPQSPTPELFQRFAGASGKPR